MNLMNETLAILKIIGRTPDDIEWVGSYDYEISLDDFWALADTEYDSGYGCQEVAGDLLVVLKDGSYMDRSEYDGAEWWSFHETPKRPETKMMDVHALTVHQMKNSCVLGTMAEMNGWDA